MKTEMHKLPNGYTVELQEKSEFIINEIWNEHCYGKDYEIKKGDVVLDLGSNQGLFALYAAFKGAVVYCYEPVDGMFQLLNKNIEQNGLNENIFSFQYAVCDCDDEIEISIPEVSDVFAPGMASIESANIDAFSKFDNASLKTQKVKTIRLKEILQKHNVINLMKIDCEGAEIDILQSADNDSLKKIKNIVMETHSGYSQKELCFLVSEYGFTIHKFDKIRSKYGAGYLFASREKENNEQFVVAIFDYKPYMSKNEIASFNGAESFNLPDINKKLNYEWYIDDIKINNQSDNLLEIDLSSSGDKVKVDLKAFDESGKSDSDSKKIVLLEDDYFKIKTSTFLKREKEKINLQAGKEHVISIKSLLLPKHFEFKRLCLSFDVLKNSSGESVPMNLVVKHNGKEQLLQNYYNVCEYYAVSSDLDMHFILKSEADAFLQLGWWVDDGTVQIMPTVDLKEGTDYSYLSNSNRTVLMPQSKEFMLNNTNNINLLIKKENLPKTWKPENIVVQISAENNPNLDLNGCKLSIESEMFDLKGWYDSGRLKFPQNERDINIQLISPVERDFSVCWWAESEEE